MPSHPLSLINQGRGESWLFVAGSSVTLCFLSLAPVTLKKERETNKDIRLSLGPHFPGFPLVLRSLVAEFTLNTRVNT